MSLTVLSQCFSVAPSILAGMATPITNTLSKMAMAISNTFFLVKSGVVRVIVVVAFLGNKQSALVVNAACT